MLSRIMRAGSPSAIPRISIVAPGFSSLEQPQPPKNDTTRYSGFVVLREVVLNNESTL
jgi:hypothetical protein